MYRFANVTISIISALFLIFISSSIFPQVPFGCIPTNDLTQNLNYYPSWHSEFRIDDQNISYELIMSPWYFNSDKMKDWYIYKQFDNYEKRVSLYKESFISALLQGELQMRFNDEYQAKKNSVVLAEKTSDELGLSSKLIKLLDAIRFGKVYDVPSDVQTTVNEWSNYVNSDVLSSRLNLLGASLATVGVGVEIYGDALQISFNRALADANTIECMNILDAHFASNSPDDPAMYAGYFLAKDEVQEYLISSDNLWKDAINAVLDQQGVFAVKGSALTLEWIKVIGGSALSHSVALGVTAIGGVLTGVIAYIEFNDDMGKYRLLCSEAMIDKWLKDCIDNYPWPTTLGSTCESARRTYYQTMMMRFALSYSSYYLYDELLGYQGRIITDVGQLLGDIISGQYNNIQEFREVVLGAYMDAIYYQAHEHQKVFDWTTIEPPSVVSVNSSVTNPPIITIQFNKNMDEGTFTTSCISVTGAVTGYHGFNNTYNQNNYKLEIRPTGAFSYSEHVTICLDECLSSWDGQSLPSSYCKTITLEDPHQVVISAWSGRNGSVDKDIEFVNIGSDLTLTAIPDPNYQVDKWYLDGELVQEGGLSYILTNIQQSHSIGITFRPVLFGTIQLLNPNGGQVYAWYSKIPISWTWEGDIGDSVNIELLKDNTVDKIIKTSNNRYYSLYITNDIDTSNNYKIVVTSLNGQYSDTSDESFTIQDYINPPDTIYCSTCAELQAIGSDGNHPTDGFYKISNDINCWGVDFQPIGNSIDNYFEGTLDGNGYQIYGLSIFNENDDNVGLFSVIRNIGIVKNLTLTDFYIEGFNYVGSIAAVNNGKIINCKITNDDALPYYPSSAVSGLGTEGIVGGIVGRNKGYIKNCQVLKTANNIDITSLGSRVGGISGLNHGTDNYNPIIEFCFTNCNIESQGSNAGKTGGIAGENSNSIIYCGSNSTVNGRLDKVGGIVGNSIDGFITGCYFTGDVTGNPSSTSEGSIGGIAGYSGSEITNCLVACSFNANNKGSICGFNESNITNCFWDINTTGLNEMYKESTYTTKYNTDWDFDNTWMIDEGNHYPALRGIGNRLNIPSNFSASTTINGGVELSWNNVTYNTYSHTENAYYKILRADDYNYQNNIKEVSEWISGNSYFDTTALPENEYYYFIKSAANNEEARISYLSDYVFGYRTQPPVPSPYDVSSSEGFVKSVLVEWEANDANYYQVYRTPLSSLKSGLTDNALKAVSEPITGWQKEIGFIDNPDITNEKYVYTVAAALDSSGFAASLLSVADTGSFTESDNTAPLIQISLNYEHPIESQNIIVSISALDNNLIDSLYLYWEALSDDSMSWYVSDTSFIDSISIGQLQAFDTLELWVVASDSLGNSGESERLTVIVAPEIVSQPIQPLGDIAILPNVSTEYVSDSSVSNLGSSLEYRFDWGDSTFSVWGDSSREYSWSEVGTYFVRAQSRSTQDTTHQSQWSEPLAVWVDSDMPNIYISTNGGNEFSWSDSFVYIEGISTTAYLDSEYNLQNALDSVYITGGYPNLGNNANFGFEVPLGSEGVPISYTITAVDQAGNHASESITITRVAAEFTILGKAYTLDSDSANCATSDPLGLWRNGIANRTAFMILGDSTTYLTDSKTDSCGNYSFEVPRSNIYIGILRDYDNAILYYFDTTFFDTVSTSVISGINFNFDNDPSNIPTDIEEDGLSQLPKVFYLNQNYPNPFNPSTVIEFDLPKSSEVSIIIYNILGQEVKKLVDRKMSAGSHQVSWDGSSSSGKGLATGIYFYRIVTEDFVDTKKMLLIK